MPLLSVQQHAAGSQSDAETASSTASSPSASSTTGAHEVFPDDAKNSQPRTMRASHMDGVRTVSLVEEREEIMGSETERRLTAELRQSSLADHFNTVTKAAHFKATARNFGRQETATRRQRQQHTKPKLHKNNSLKDKAWLLRTQNVRGLPKTKAAVNNWFSLLRRQEGYNVTAITMLQETHVLEGEASAMCSSYRAHWGFNANAKPMSYWSEAGTRAGGVAILLNPYKVTGSAAALTHLWSPHFVAITATLEDSVVLVVNVYAPSEKSRRETFYDLLATQSLDHDGPILMGGDFNCTQDGRRDRSYGTQTQSHVSPALTRLLAKWDMIDSLQPVLDEATTPDLDDAFKLEHHTYWYKVGEREESSRLDRWYVTARTGDWLMATTTTDLGGGSDHASVSVAISNPSTRARTQARPRLYPPKQCAAAAVTQASSQALDALGIAFSTLEENVGAASEYVAAWEAFKARLIGEITTVSKAAVKATNQGFKQKIRRIRRQMKTCRANREGREATKILAAKLTAVTTHWQTSKRRGLSATHNWGRLLSSKDFYARVAVKFGDTTIHALTLAEGGRERDPLDVANIMADAWSPIFTQQVCTEAPTIFDRQFGDSIDTATADGINAVFTEKEVLTAIKRCKRTKSGGPDRLPNAWYRDHQDQVEPLLRQLFNQCYTAGISPPSFQQANIVCLAKAGRSLNPMNYRPIALLNSDYKIFTRLLTNRVRPCLPNMIAEVQGGFVPGRTIHGVIDVFTAAQLAAKRMATETVAVLLDFQKAYDSVNRAFMMDNLRHRGFPRRFLAAVAATHTDTTARFLVNGQLSTPVASTCGIRQGCPLAPLLFILVLDPLYQWLLHDAELLDPLTAAVPDFPTVSGYADDTTVFLANETKIPRLLAVLDDFARASGLVVNAAKTNVIRLNESSGTVTNAHGLRALAVDDYCRYLGIQVGTRPIREAVWELSVQQLTTRLRMAKVKTHTAAQRAQLAAGIIVPKLLFVARHHWPDATMIHALDQRLRRFVWKGCFALASEVDYSGAPWMNKSLASLAPRDGGLGVPCLHTEIITMASHTVASWAYATTDLRTTIVRAAGWLPPSATIQPRMVLGPESPPVILKRSLWLTGEATLRAVYSTSLSRSQQLHIQDGIQALDDDYDNPWQWWRGAYERDYSSFYRVGGQDITRVLEESLGSLSVEWIRRIRLDVDDAPILTAAGTALHARHLAILGKGTTVQDFVSWTWCAHGTLRFVCNTAPYPFSKDQAPVFRSLCDTLVANFPLMVTRPRENGLMHVYNIPADHDHEWWLADDATALEHRQHGWCTSKMPVTSQWDLLRLPTVAVDEVKTIPELECGPTLTSMVQVWRGQLPWRPNRKHLRNLIAAGKRDQGRAAKAERKRKWEEDDPHLASLLAKIPWPRATNMEGLSSQDRQLWHKVKLHQLNSWDSSRDVNTCPHEQCDMGTDHGTGHILWRCTRAQALWRQLGRFWKAVPQTEDGLARAIFSWATPDSTHNWRAMLTTNGTIAVHGEQLTLQRLAHWQRVAWIMIVTAGVKTLWATQCAALHPTNATQSRDDYFSALHDVNGRMRDTIAGIAHMDGEHRELDIAIQRVLCQFLLVDRDDAPLHGNHEQQYLLFFDGGSRGNPGPGGSGAVVVQVGDSAETSQVVWTASMSYSKPTTTNNFAEYKGLCTGLAAAAQHHWSPLSVIGDSMMIIQQMTRKRQPRVAALAPLYHAARSYASRILVLGWTHHYRTYNKMADQAANVAMDAVTSHQALATANRPDQASILSWMTNDVAHWISARDPTTQRSPETATRSKTQSPEAQGAAKTA